MHGEFLETVRDGSMSPSIAVRWESERHPSDIVSLFDTGEEATVILWYIGRRGLRKENVDFYRDEIISPILHVNSKIRFCLVDLTAWNAFTPDRGDIFTSSRWVNQLNTLEVEPLTSISSSSILRRILRLEEGSCVDYLRMVLRRSELWVQSAAFAEVGLSIGECVGFHSAILEEIRDVDVARCYSAFQYLEGVFLVDHVVREKSHANDNSEICVDFVIPNNEIEYYARPQGFFQKDLRFILNQNERAVSVRMMPFQFGSHSEQRPYNAPGVKLCRSQLSSEMILGYFKEWGLCSAVNY